mmetsp:Transcript_15237/g.20150  ORF Transcript_15237/g.20150 Transcript_15237/m.20150 type:complete len:146 (-) Transcript_15237:770-1207(-)
MKFFLAKRTIAVNQTHLTSRVQTTLGTYVNSYAYGKIIQASVAGVNDSPEDLFYQGAGALLRKSPREASAIYEMALVEKKGVETDDALAPIVLGAAVAAHAEGKEDLASQHLHQVLMASPTLKAALLVRSKKQSTQPFSPIAFFV